MKPSLFNKKRYHRDDVLCMRVEHRGLRRWFFVSKWDQLRGWSTYSFATMKEKWIELYDEPREFVRLPGVFTTEEAKAQMLEFQYNPHEKHIQRIEDANAAAEGGGSC